MLKRLISPYMLSSLNGDSAAERFYMGTGLAAAKAEGLSVYYGRAVKYPLLWNLRSGASLLSLLVRSMYRCVLIEPEVH